MWPSGPGRPILLCCLLRSCFLRFKEKEKKKKNRERKSKCASRASCSLSLGSRSPSNQGGRLHQGQPGLHQAQPPGDGDGFGHWLCSFPSCEASEQPPERGGAILGWMCAPRLASVPWRWFPQPRRTVGSPMAVVGSSPQASPASGCTACPWQNVTCPPGGTCLSPPVLRGADSPDSSLS